MCYNEQIKPAWRSPAARDSGMNYWPGFVGAVDADPPVIFLLTVLWWRSSSCAGIPARTRRWPSSTADHAAQPIALARADQQVQSGRRVNQLRASLNAAEGERDRLRGAAAQSQAAAPAADNSGKLNSQIDLEKEATARAIAQIENLNQQITALRRQMAALESALGQSEQKEKDSQLRVADLGQRLNVALAQRVQELSRYRSDFFGKLREILGNRPDIRVVGDRWCSSPRCFTTAAPRPCGRKPAELDKLASALLDLDKQIPSEINWVLRVDGHTDSRPLGATSPFKSNWDLSAARAISVVQYLISRASRRCAWSRPASAVPADRPGTPMRPSAATAASN